jgi:YebC/PmpR family DNA-binding regulatory protein
MSGHSKWATIKHKKGAQDKARGKLFAKLIRQVEVAARDGGGDLSANATLRTMYAKARDASVPVDTIERAIKRGTGELEGVRYEAVSYEGYAGAGVAVLVECLTDNRNRTGAEVRSIFSRNGGSIAEPGAVSWQFDRKGLLELAGEIDEDTVLTAGLDAGLEEAERAEDAWRLTCEPTQLASLRAALEAAGLEVRSAELVMVPQATIEVDDPTAARKVLRLLDALEDHDDVQNVWSNFDIPDAVLEEVSL